ncbi:hypothetical protein A3A79_00365 [Candidatus Gottesmanbacteria bacterium RIFCSPLOWO2_01_FULL_43_11b]|uniref:Uncharacterized protein n=1 Tax=Candidatus Gottesmanbacteria bacterium RIFCSPLOWO2_01_FULL_43_11b TaxID=1798392 RepID=A0A1F6AHA6_9BACT|nr:MAG: hypothetical protein A3A79_00365 [Candidatus Gottesmanbacteria bacterium RIFCSPLOWO2_01_FULL_43_11b]
MKKLQKIVSVLSVGLLVFGQLAPIVRAQEAPTAPTAPSAPEAPTYDEPAPTPPPAPTLEEETTTNTEETPPEEQQTEETTVTQTSETEEGGEDGSGGNVGDTEINTGDATTTATGMTEANNNSSSIADCCESEGITVANTGNGSDSTNTGSVVLADTNNTFQNNSATVVSDVDGESNTGDNDSSGNVGNTTINTGDANTSGTLITAVNTNVDGIMVSEFNVIDDHVGDIILDFNSGCISGCGGDTAIINSGNGSDSTNTGTADITNADNTFQTNDATVLNGMVLDSNSGDNTGDKNTGGDTTITTGDANISANLLTFANNNLSGDVIYSVVNIYGDLLGDIIFPESEFTNCCGTSATLANTGNGSDSTNTTDVNLTNTDTSVQNNVAIIENNLDMEATSGDNSTSKNTGGNNSITTGDTSIDAQVVNVANTNIDGGNWWLVLVNEAGNWIGHILGADGSYAGSVGTEFEVNEAGEITVTNSGNGSGSTNTGTVNQDTSNTTIQNNTAHVVNNVTLDANTGGNSASKNTGGNSTIETGDANIVANIVNFVNNNIIGGGKLFVTVINVFGSWTGNFLPPGFQKPAAQAANNPEIGGADVHQGSNSQSNSNSQSSNSSGNSGNSSTTTTATVETTDPEGTTQLTFAAGQLGSVHILGTTTTDDAEPVTQGRQVVQINLAWLLLLIPCAILLVVLRRLRRNASATAS